MLPIIAEEECLFKIAVATIIVAHLAQLLVKENQRNAPYTFFF